MFLKILGAKKRFSEYRQGIASFADSDAFGIHPVLLIIISSIWLATFGNLALWQELSRLPEMNDLRALWFVVSFALLIIALSCMLLSLLCWRWTLKPVLFIFLLVAAFGSHFMLTYGVVIDSSMVVNVLQTDIRESRDLMSLKMLLTVLVLALLPIVWLWQCRVKSLSVLRHVWHNLLLFGAGLLLSAVAVLPTYQDFASTMRNHVQLRYLINPLNSFYALGRVLFESGQKGASAIIPIGEDIKQGATYAAQAKVPLLVLVVGETARSGNFALNGYTRDTTPNLGQLQKNLDGTGALSSFSNVWACGTSTATALPCMFSHLNKDAYEDSQDRIENLVDVLQRAGMAVLWLENQSGCKGLCDRIPWVSTVGSNEPAYCSSGECFDEVMLHQLTERLEKLPLERIDKGIVVILHQMGSHGPAYYKRTPPEFKKFQPECSTNTLQDCTRAQVTNAYDNTLLYTDYFLNAVVKFLKDKEPHAQTAMIYVADHGESLGENNIYLHGLPYAIAPDVQKKVPWISWLSNDFLQRNGINQACLVQKSNERLSHDNYFHSVLGLLDLKTAVYKPELDAYASCSKK